MILLCFDVDGTLLISEDPKIPAFGWTMDKGESALPVAYKKYLETSKMPFMQPVKLIGKTDSNPGFRLFRKAFYTQLFNEIYSGAIPGVKVAIISNGNYTPENLGITLDRCYGTKRTIGRATTGFFEDDVIYLTRTPIYKREQQLLFNQGSNTTKNYKSKAEAASLACQDHDCSYFILVDDSDRNLEAVKSFPSNFGLNPCKPKLEAHLRAKLLMSKAA